MFADYQRAGPETRGFWWSCCVALAALAVSALLTVSAYVLLSTDAGAYRSGDISTATAPRVIHGGDLVARIGTTRADTKTSLELTQLAGDRAILTQHLALPARDYDFLQYRISGRNPSQSIYLIWRTDTNPRQIYNLRLSWSGETAETVRLAGHPDWQGSVTEIGLDIYGELRGQPMVIRDLTLLPGSVTALLASIWSKWSAFSGWSQKSINYLGDPGSPFPTPVEAAATWAGLAIALLLLARAPQRGQSSLILGITILVPWIALDMLWQRELNTQEAETDYLFKGKTMHERHLADEDRDIYAYANRLKTDVLPNTPSRILILHDSDEHDYVRLKTQYHLLPHNIYNYGRYPETRGLRPGDFVLVLGTVPGLSFDEASRKLAWGAGQQLGAKLLDRDARGTLLQIVPHESND